MELKSDVTNDWWLKTQCNKIGLFVTGIVSTLVWIKRQNAAKICSNMAKIYYAKKMLLQRDPSERLMKLLYGPKNFIPELKILRQLEFLQEKLSD